MTDKEVRDYLKQLTMQIRGHNGKAGEKITREQIDSLIDLVHAGQLDPSNYEKFRKESTLAKNGAFALKKSDIDEYKDMNPTTADDAIDLAASFNGNIPDHVLNILAKFRQNGQISKDMFDRLTKPSGKKQSTIANATNQSKTSDTSKTAASDTNKNMATTNSEQAEKTATDTISNTAGQDPFVQVSLSTIFKQLHLKAVQEVDKATGGKVKIINTAYDQNTGVFNTSPNIYKVIAQSTKQSGLLTGWFRSKAARKALVIYLNALMGPELAERFKNASLYQPTTTDTNGTVKTRRGIFGRIADKFTNKSNEVSDDVGSKGAVKDVTDKTVSYWMKYKLVNGANANESWISFAMPGKPLVITESVKPCESAGWTKLTVRRLMLASQQTRLTPTEQFVESVLNDENAHASAVLKQIVESKIAKRLSKLN